MLGSPGYMAPEQYAAAAIDHRADLFAAGVVFYQLVTGAKPFVGTTEQVSYATCHSDALRPSLADPGKGWERYDPVVAKALAKRPEDRFQTAEAFRAAILAAHAAPAAPAVSEETIIAEVLRPAAAVDLSSVPSRPLQGLAPRPAAGPAAARPARRWAWAIGSAAAVVAAVFAAWQAGWFAPARPSAEVQAQLAKARAEAEEAERRAKTEAAAAAEAKRQLELERAAEAKSARARAETQTKRRAQTEATPRKEDAQLAAASKNREPSPKPAAPAQEKAQPAQTLPRWLWSSQAPAGTAQEKAPTAAASRYDGAWTATRSCDAFEEFPAQVQNWAFTVKGGEFVVERGAAGQPGHNLGRGRPGDGGNLVLSGTGINSAQRLRGKPYPVLFEGRFDGDRFVMKGRLGERACTLVLARG